jgi:hypothetical protein
MASGEVGDVGSVLFRYDALAEDVPAARRRLLFDAPPAPGDRVLVIDGRRARVMPFEEYTAPRTRVWLVAVVRVLGALLGVVLVVAQEL